MTHTTISARGSLLPVGIESIAGGERERTYAFRRWNMQVEMDIGKARDRHRSLSPGALVTEILARLLVKWGPHDFERMPIPERILALKRAYGADVYHAWLDLRREVMGNDATLSMTCVCKHEFGYDVDLGTVEEAVVEDDEVMARPHLLRDGIDYRGAIRKALTLEPTRWMVLEAVTDDGLNIGAIKARFICGTVTALGDEQVVLVPEMLKDMSKYDMEHLFTAIGEHSPGPDLSLSVECPRCRTVLKRALDWTYDAFFSAGSSRSGSQPR